MTKYRFLTVDEHDGSATVWRTKKGLERVKDGMGDYYWCPNCPNDDCVNLPKEIIPKRLYERAKTEIVSIEITVKERKEKP